MHAAYRKEVEKAVNMLPLLWFHFFFKARISPAFYSSGRESLYNIELAFIKYQ